MEILTLSQLDILKKTGASVALGTFDGVHMGHRRILSLAKENANGMPVLCYTFENIPASIFSDSKQPIYTMQEKLAALADCGVDYVYMPRFTREFSQQSSGEFLDFLRDRLHAHALAFGFNYSFGFGAQGDAQVMCEYAKKNGIVTSVGEGVSFEGETVSSSRIRALLSEGDISRANIMLTSPFTLTGEVVHGKHLGHRIGFPTINFVYPNKIEVKRGVYISRVELHGVKYPAITNIGVRPTVENTDNVNVETHIIGCEEELYGSTVSVELHAFRREERRFEGVEALVRQLEKDKKIALQYDFSMLQ